MILIETDEQTCAGSDLHAGKSLYHIYITIPYKNIQ